MNGYPVQLSGESYTAFCERRAAYECELRQRALTARADALTRLGQWARGSARELESSRNRRARARRERKRALMAWTPARIGEVDMLAPWDVPQEILDVARFTNG